MKPAAITLIAAWLCVPAALAQDAPEPADDDGDAASPPAVEGAGPGRLRPEPLWEVGIVGGGGWLPDYPAADENHLNGLALPYAIYRGRAFRVGDGGGPRGLFVDVPWLEINLGLDAAFPVDSDDNDAREGMDDLDTLLEIGPRIIAKLRPLDPINELDLSLATRAVLSTDFAGVGYQGITVNPALTYRRNDLLGIDLRFVASLGGIFGFDGLNDYFYEVEEDDVRPDRPRFRADDGYIGSELSLGFSWGITPRLRVFGGTQIGYWGGAANEDSPLHRDDVTIGIGGGLRWSIFASEQMVVR